MSILYEKGVKTMREIHQNMDVTIAQVNSLKGESVRLKVNRGRNKIEYIEGVVECVYPKIFTIKEACGSIKSFSYNDILSKNVYFYKN